MASLFNQRKPGAFRETLRAQAFPLVATGTLLVLWLSFFGADTLSIENHYSLLAQGFLSGTAAVNIDEAETVSDFSFFDNHYYVPWGPMPALLLAIPTFTFGASFSQVYFAMVMNIVNFILVAHIARRLGYATLTHQALIASTFFFGSAYIGISTALFSSWIALIVGVSFLLLGINEYLSKRRKWLIGLYVAAAGMTRPTLFVALLFFILAAWDESRPHATTSEKQGDSRALNLRARAARLLPLVLPLGGAIMLLGIYNYIRFGGPLETGYGYMLLPDILLDLKQQGLFSLEHMAQNLYYLFFKLPEVRGIGIGGEPFGMSISPWGLSIFITSPYLLTLIPPKLANRILRYALVTAGMMVIPATLWFGNGYIQYGYRYALDFFPFLFLAFLAQHEGKLTRGVTTLMVAAIILNITLFIIFLSNF